MALVDLDLLVDQLFRDDDARLAPYRGDGPARRRAALDLAVRQLSRDAPRHLAVDVTATGGTDLPVPPDWVEGESTLVGVEYPPGQPWPAEEFGTGRTPAGEVPVLRRAVPEGAELRLALALPHRADESVDTVPPGWREAVASYAAAILYDQLAGATAGDRASTIQADGIDHAGRSERYAARARELRRRYYDLLGLDPKRTRPAGAMIALSRGDTRGRPRLLRHG